MNKAHLALAALAAASLLSSCASPVIFAGATTGGVMATDNRTPGSFIEDQGIEVKAWNDLRNEVGDWARASVTSMNRIALVVGQAPNEDVRDRIEKIVASQENVRRVINQVTIAEPLSLTQIGRDTLITSQVKSALLVNQDDGFSSLRVKVVTEDGVVYLMGLVTKENAAVAIEKARNVSGVRQVVQAFEFVEPGPAPVKSAN